jgi:hypothetical protein
MSVISTATFAIICGMPRSACSCCSSITWSEQLCESGGCKNSDNRFELKATNQSLESTRRPKL